MTTEITPADVDADADIAVTIAATAAAAEPEEKPEPVKVRKQQAKKRDDIDSDSEEDKPLRSPVSPELKKVMAAEDGDLRDVLDTIGTDGSFKISVSRVEPEQARDPATGRMVKVDGHLKTYTQKIDQEFIASRHGGGRFRLNFLKKAADGSYKIHTKRVIDIAGDPRTDDVPRNIDPVSPQQQQHAQNGAGQESPSVVKEVLGVMKDQLDKAHERAQQHEHTAGPDAATMMLIESMKADREAMREELRELRQRLAEAMAPKPAEESKEEKFKDSMLTKLLDGDSARLQAVRMQYESEIRTLRENHREDEKRIYDRHERQLADLKQSHDREIAFIKSSYEATGAAVKVSLDTSKEVLNGQINQLKRENDSLREEVKELRAKKEKSPLDMAKEVKIFKEAFGGDDDKEESSTVEQIVTALPQAIEVAQGIINKNKPQPQQQQPQQQAPQRPQLVRAPNGDVFQQRGNELIPVKKKGQRVAVQQAEGQPPQEVEIPAIDPQKLEMAISYLERAYSGNQAPEVVAQSARPLLPDEIMSAIQTLGIDVFFAKVAKLPSASPLAGQAGKNWIRKVGKALVGE